MVRSALLALAASAVLLSGCGASDDPVAPAPLPLGPGAPVQPLTGVRPVEKTDGRLGAATTARPAGGLEELSPGGRPDVRPRATGGRHDGVGAGATCPDQSLAPAPATLAAMAGSQLCLLNGVRADAGLPPLTLNPKLSAAASAYAADLVAHSYFSHTGLDGSTIRTRLEAVGYLPADGGWAIGENLAWGTGALATPGSIMQAWMNSAGHRENILNPEYREIGIGVVAGNPSSANGAGATYANAFGVIDEVEESEPVAETPPASRPAKKSGRRKGARRRAGKHRGRKARIAAHKGGRKHKKKSRGPLARIAI
jgi:uncharacterized protein YkwD